MPTATEMKNTSLDVKREEFRKYLEKEGVKSTEDSKEVDNTKEEEKVEVKEADDKKDEAKNESESTEKTPCSSIRKS